MLPHQRRELTSETIALGRSLCDALEQSFSARFDLWAKEDEWHIWPHDRSPLDPRQQQCIADVLPADASGKASSFALSGNRQIVAVPIFSNPESCLAAVGIVPTSDPKLARSVADMTCQLLGQRRALELAETRLVGYASQVTTDFEELSWLRTLSQQIDVCDLRNDIDSVVRATLPSVRELIRAEALYLFGVASSHAQMPFRTVAYREGSTNLTDESAHALVSQWSASVTSQPLVRNAPNYHSWIPDARGVRNAILVRIAKDERSTGWLLAVNKRPARRVGADAELQDWSCGNWEFGTVEAGLLHAVATILGTHNRNLGLFREKEALMVGIIRAMINAIDAKDAYTNGHSERVASMAKGIAQQLGLSTTECAHIYVTGLLHDIGKIGVPDQILRKPDRLTEEEFAIIKQHPEIGASIVKHVEPLAYALPGVMYHHERIDGAGYPMGLEGERIPLHGRILAVADAYDAMTSHRPYRPGMPTETAERILQEGKGTQWDPEVVDAFFAIRSEMHRVCGASSEESLLDPTQTIAPPVGDGFVAPPTSVTV